MPAPQTVAPRDARPFLYAEPGWQATPIQMDVAYLGLPFSSGYASGGETGDQADAPDAMRRATARISRGLDRYDFDLGGTLYDGTPLSAVDLGNVSGSPRDGAAHLRRAEAVLRMALGAGALPVLLGGDHGAPLAALRALESVARDGEPITLVQIDQHIDWRDEVDGVRDGLSSVIRRASELPWIGDIWQIGLRATGSARPEEVDAALAHGAHLVTAEQWHEDGPAAILAQLPENGRFYLTMDMDGFDPADAPGVLLPSPGGLRFAEVRQFIHGLVRRGRVVGMDVVEITPRWDVNNRTCVTAGRLIVNLVGAAVRAGYWS